MIELLLENLPPAVRAVRKLYDLRSGGYFIPMRHEMKAVDDSYIPQWRHKLPVLYDCVEVPVADILFSLVFNLRGKKVLETGTSRGFSTCHLAAAVVQQHGTVITVDPFPAPWFLWQDSALAPIIRHIPKNAEDAVIEIEKILDGDQFDVMFLDSLHSYQHLSKEIQLFDKYLKLGGLIILHDTMYYDCLGLLAVELYNNRGYELINIPTHRSHDYESRSPGLTIMRKVTDDRDLCPLSFEQGDFTNGEQTTTQLEGRLRRISDTPLVDILSARRFKLQVKTTPQGIVDTGRRAKFYNMRGHVSKTVEAVRSLTPTQRQDIAFIQNELIPFIGLNDELLSEQPKECSKYFGTGLHLWQYPNQIAPYLEWLSVNAKEATRYLEIGCRWGGMTILTAEWLRASGAKLEQIIVVDPIEPSPFIKEYFNLLDREGATIKHLYLQALSTDEAVKHEVVKSKPDFIFIDGDHSFSGAFADHEMVKSEAKIIVHHDIASSACPDIGRLWEHIKLSDAERFEFEEFTAQYASVGKPFLGIGVMKAKHTTPSKTECSCDEDLESDRDVIDFDSAY